MRIKGKLACAFLIITLLPIVLLGASFSMIYYAKIGTSQGAEEDSGTLGRFVSNPVQLMNRMTEDIFKTMKKDSKIQSEYLEDSEYLNCYNEELAWKYSFLVVKKGKEFSYIGNEAKFSQVEKRLDENVEQNLSETGSYLGGDHAFLVKQCNFSFSDHTQGSFYVITYVDGFLPAIRSIFVQFILCFLVIIFLTASMLILWIYRGMVRPINMLKKATHRMRDGDLDFSIHSESEDEIGMLCKDFEEMRIRLKESIEMRLVHEQEMQELVSNISHDLKTPLTAIEGYTEGIMDGVADTPQKREKYLRIIHKKSKEMSMLVDELSMSAKIENGIVPYNFRYVNVAEYFGDCVEEIRMDLDIQNISLVYENQVETDVRVEMDAEQLKRVINNIVGNAMKFMESDKGVLRIYVVDENKKQVKQKKTERSRKDAEEHTEKKKWTSRSKKEKSQWIRVIIQDDGKGIAKEDLPHIFERFYRADASRHSPQSGSGLGLAISKKIIEDHGGKIWAESEEGVGTSISFTLKKEKVEKGEA